MDYCPHCMVPAKGEYCTNCGKKISEFNQSSDALPLGTILVNPISKKRYQLGEALGQGGFGITYAALDLDTGQRVAIKEYFPSRNQWATRSADRMTVITPPEKEANYYGGRKSFVKEAQVMADISGKLPNIVKGLDYLEVNNTAYLVMEFIDGKPLFQVISSKGRMTADQLLPRIRPLMNDLDRLHKEYKVLHRDICPDNIMVMPDGSFKLIDLGSARKMDPNSPMTVYIKPGYAPVEQSVSGEELGSWTDVYCLAATMYYCLTGTTPPDSYERLNSLNAVQRDALVPPIAAGAVMTEDQEAVLLQAMIVKADNRIRSMREFSDRLFGYTDPSGWTETLINDSDDTIPAHTVPDQQPKVIPAIGDDTKKKKGILIGAIAAAAAIILIIIVIVIIAMSGSGKKKNPAPDPNPPFSQTPQYVTTASPEEGSTDTEPSVTEPPATELPATEPSADTTVATEPSNEQFKVDYLTYEVRNGSAVVIGFSGSSSRGVFRIPSDANGYDVTAIASGAFDQYCHLESVILPSTLKEIEDGAFESCDNLRDLVVFSTIKANEPIKNCKKFRAVAGTNSVNGWKLPDNVKTYSYGMEIELTTDYYQDVITGGQCSLVLTAVYVTDDGCIYALAEDPDDDTTYSVLMDVPAGLEEITVPEYINSEEYPTSWADNHAFDNADEDLVVYLSSGIIMSDEFYYERYYGLHLNDYDEIPISFYWAINKNIEVAVNQMRPSGWPIAIDWDILAPSQVRVEEIAEDYSNGRPSGETIGDLLNEYEIDWNYASGIKGNSLGDFLSDTIDSLSEEDTSDYGTYFYERFCAAIYKDPESNSVYYYLFAVC